MPVPRRSGNPRRGPVPRNPLLDRGRQSRLQSFLGRWDRTPQAPVGGAPVSSPRVLGRSLWPGYPERRPAHARLFRQCDPASLPMARHPRSRALSGQHSHAAHPRPRLPRPLHQLVRWLPALSGPPLHRRLRVHLSAPRPAPQLGGLPRRPRCCVPQCRLAWLGAAAAQPVRLRQASPRQGCSQVPGGTWPQVAPTNFEPIRLEPKA